MLPNDDPLENVADAILDGTPIDWAAVESMAGEHRRPLIDRLRLLAALAEIHRDPAGSVSVADNEPHHVVEARDGSLTQWGHLRLLEPIGSGAFGQVYRARDTRLDRDVALKLLPAHPASPDKRVSSIIEEGRLLARVRHPNVVTIHGAEQIGNRVGLWMEFVKGRTLEQLLEQGRRFTVPDTTGIGIQLCLAVSAVHEAGLLHRDIKAQNVMIAEDGRIVLMDFGTGWDLNDNTRAGLAGTPLYLAPELLEGKAATVQSDVYALGVLLYHLLTAGYPVGARRIHDLRRAHARDDRVDLRSVRPDVAARLAGVIARAIDPEPARRYPNAAAMADDLRRSKTVVSRRAWAALVPLVVIVTLLVSVSAGRRTGGSSQGAAGRPPAALAPTPVTTTPGNKFHPALSPDGTRVAFVWDRYGEFEIYVKPVDDDTTIQVTRATGGENDPAWSPDGRSLVFRRLFKDAASTPLSAVVTIPAQGGAEKVLWRGGANVLGAGVDWSPDGRHVAVSARASAGERQRILLLAVNGDEPRWLTSPPTSTAGDSDPAFSPDSESIAFVRNTGSASSLHILHVTDERLVQLPVEGHDIRHVSWSEDGRTLVFTSYRGGGRDRLWRVPVSGGAAELVAGIGEGASAPSVGRRGGRMVYLHTFLDSDLYRADLTADGAAGIRKVVTSNRADTQPDISPDGARIAFVSDRGGSAEIWVANTDGTNPKQLTALGTLCRYPRWSPDGRRIVFSARSSEVDRRSIYVAEASNGVVRRVTSGLSNDLWPTWSADGQSIYFTADHNKTRDIWKVSADGGQAVQITRTGGSKGWESSDGQFLYYATNTPAIWRIPSGGGAPTLVLPLAKNTTAGGEWVPVLDGIYWMNTGAPRRVRFEFFSSASGLNTQAIEPPGSYDYGSGFSVSRDGRWLLFAQREYQGANIMMIEGFQ